MPAIETCPSLCVSRGRALAAAIILLAFAVAPAAAQTITDAQRVEFAPSADHNAVDAEGVALVDQYTLYVYVAGSTTAYATANLGKPAPESDGMIRVSFAGLLSAPLAMGVVYETRISADGPAGSGLSGVSNTFALTTTCASTVTPLAQSVAAGGGTGTASVAAACGWAALSDSSWITITSGATGTGNGTVGFTVAVNAVTSPRTGTLTIAGNSLTVTQAAASCSFSIAPTSQSVAAAGGSGTVTVTSTAGCPWTASSNAGWLSITAGASGNGSGSVTFSAGANTATATRSGTLTIAGSTFTVNQAAAACSYSLGSTSLAMAAGGGTGSVGVTAASGCAWTASSSASWLTVTSGASGSGNGTVAFSATANTGTGSRTGTLLIGGITFTVTQVACAYTVSPLTISAPGRADTGTISVTTTAGCTWTSSSPAGWATLAGSGSASGTATYTLTANMGTAVRSATLVVAGRQVSLTQAVAVPPSVPSRVRVIR